MYIQSLKTLGDVLTLTASEEVSTFEVANVQDPSPTARWRSTGTTPFIVIEFASPISVDFWGPWYTNAISGDQVRLRLADTQANLTAAPLHDSGLVNVWPGTGDLSEFYRVHSRNRITSPVSSSWARIDFDYSSNPDGYVEVGSLPIGVRFTPTRGPTDGWEFQGMVRGQYTAGYAAGGHGRGGGSRKYMVSFQLLGMTETEVWGGLELLDRKQAGSLPIAAVFAEVDDYPMSRMFFGFLTVKSVVATGPNQYRVSCSITEP